MTSHTHNRAAAAAVPASRKTLPPHAHPHHHGHTQSHVPPHPPRSLPAHRRPLSDISNHLHPSLLPHDKTGKPIRTHMKSTTTIHPTKSHSILTSPIHQHMITEDDLVEMSDDEEPVEKGTTESEKKRAAQEISYWHDPSLEYANQILEILHANELRYPVSPHYMSTHQPDLNGAMRSILLDWLIEVCEEYKLSDQTLLLTCNYIDRFLSRKSVERTKLQLVGCTCMLIAAKYEEIYPPTIDDFVYISDNTYTRDAVVAMETLILTTLSFALTIVTPLEFVKRIAKECGLDRRQHSLIHYLLCLFMQDLSYLKYTPSIIATAAVSLSLYLTHHQHWHSTLEMSSGYQQTQIDACRRDMNHVHSNVTLGQGIMKAARAKFTLDKFHNVATIPARSL